MLKPLARFLKREDVILLLLLLLFLIQDFSPEDFEYLVEDWETKIERCGRGDQKWGLFHAKKSV